MHKFYDAIKQLGYSVKYIKSLHVIDNDSVRSTYNMREMVRKITQGVPPYNTDNGWSSNALDILSSAASAGSDSSGNYMAVVEDDGEIIALCFYTFTSVDTDWYFTGSLNTGVTELLYLDWLAGKGKGGGVTLVHELMQIAEASNVILLLQSTSGARSFYESVGFEKSLDPAYYYWLPSRLRDGVDKNLLDADEDAGNMTYLIQVMESERQAVDDLIGSLKRFQYYLEYITTPITANSFISKNCITAWSEVQQVSAELVDSLDTSHNKWGKRSKVLQQMIKIVYNDIKSLLNIDLKSIKTEDDRDSVKDKINSLTIRLTNNVEKWDTYLT
jgi:hypothetical protein